MRSYARSGGGRRMTERFIEHLRLVDAFARDGCPVCRCLVDDSRRFGNDLQAPSARARGRGGR